MEKQRTKIVGQKGERYSDGWQASIGNNFKLC